MRVCSIIKECVPAPSGWCWCGGVSILIFSVQLVGKWLLVMHSVLVVGKWLLVVWSVQLVVCVGELREQLLILRRGHVAMVSQHKQHVVCVDTLDMI